MTAAMVMSRPRREVVYVALTSLRALELIRRMGREGHFQRGEENRLLQELAGIVDAALESEVRRRRSMTSK